MMLESNFSFSASAGEDPFSISLFLVNIEMGSRPAFWAYSRNTFMGVGTDDLHGTIRVRSGLG